MNFTAFDANWGQRQGRIAPAGWTPALGAYVFVLGSDVSGWAQSLLDGDYAEVSQAFSLAAVKRIRFSGHVRPPTVALPDNLSGWVFELRVDGTVYASVAIAPGARERSRFDIAADVGTLGAGDHTVAFRLRFFGAAATIYEPEFPGVYVDAVTLDPSTATPQLQNRDPEPGELGAPATGFIKLELADSTGAGVDLAATQVFVDGVLAFTSGAATAGFNGAGSGVSNPFANVARIVLAPVLAYPSLHVVTVRVLSDIVSGGHAIDQSYSFTIADTEGPAVSEAVAIADKVIRLTWGESVVQVAPGGADDALTPANYTLQVLAGKPAVTPTVASVRTVGSSQVELTTDIEMTPGATYLLLVNGVADLFGNVSAGPSNGATFMGYRAPSPEGRVWNWWEWFQGGLAQNDASGDLRRLVAVVQEPWDVELAKLDRFPETLDIDAAPDEWLDLLLYDAGNPFDFAYELEPIDKRRLLDALPEIFRTKGTDPGIIDTIRFFNGIDITITVPSWLGFGALLGNGTLGSDSQSGGTLVLGSSALSDVYHWVATSAVALTEDQLAQMNEIIRFMMRAGTTYEIVQPGAAPTTPDHAVLGISRLNLNFRLH